MKRLALLVVLFFFGILLPLPGTAQEQPAPWVEPLDDEGVMPLPTARHLRIPLRVPVPEAMDGVLDLPVSATVDLTQALADAGWPTKDNRLAGFRLDMGSFRMREVDDDGRVLDHDVPFDLFPAGSQLEPFDAADNPVVTLQWILTGESVGGTNRHYHVYFDGTHHPAKSPPQRSPEATAALAASVGPGRGTHHYVSLPNIPGIQGDKEPRAVRVTSLAGPVTVKVYEYTDLHRRPSPTATLQIGGTGAQAVYSLGNGGTLSSNGLVMLKSTGPVATEMLFNAPSNTFLPALDGGLAGHSFLMPMASNDGSQITVNCLAASGQTTCGVRLNGGPETNIASHDATNFNAQGVVRLEATRGLITVQRDGPSSSIPRALTAWPAIDGPDAASLLLGRAGSGDRLLMMSSDPSTVRVQSLVGGKPVLTPSSGLDLDEGLFGSWTTSWNRVWRPGDQGNSHEGGPASILRVGGDGRLTVISGPGQAAIAPLQPPLPSLDTGFTYRFELPADDNGIPFGQLIVFATADGTTITGVRKAPTGTTTHEWPSRARHEAIRIDEPGEWILQADKPFTATWLLPGNRPVSAFAPGVTDAIQPVVGAAQITGYLLDVGVDRPLVRAEPGQQVTIPFTVTNNARSVTGAGVQDTAVLRITTPSGWNGILSQSEVELGPGESVDLEAFVQLGTGTHGGDVRIEAESVGNPGFAAEQAVRISFVVTRGVLVTADGSEVVSERPTRPGEAVTYRVEVLNTGGVPDRYRVMTTEPREEWTVEFDPPLDEDASGQHVTSTIGAGESRAYIATVMPDAQLTAGRLTMQLLATSVSDRSVSDGVRFVTTLDADRSYRVQVVDGDRVVAPGTHTEYHVRIVNEADVNEDLLVEVRPAEGDEWPDPSVQWVGVGSLEDADHRVSIKPRSEALLVVNRSIPPTAPPLTVAIDRLQFTSTSPGREGADAVLRSQVARVSTVTAALSPAIAAAAPGGTAGLDMDLAAAGNAPGRVEVVPVGPPAWGFVNATGAQGPWSLELEPGESEGLSINVEVPLDAPPGEPTPIAFRLVSPGRPTQVVTSEIIVAEGPDLRMDGGDAPLHLNRPTVVQVPVRNIGNVPLDVVAWLDGLPDGWSAENHTAHLDLGQEGVLSFVVTPQTTGRTVVAEVRARAEGLDVTAEWHLTVGTPDLSARVEWVRHEGSASIYEVVVRNDGTESAFQVDVALNDDGEVVDRVMLLQVRPGAQHTVHLVGPAAAVVHVSASHDPTGFKADGENLDLGGEDRTASAPLSPLLLAGLGVMVLLRRRWRS